jgi:hypothetical protein
MTLAISESFSTIRLPIDLLSSLAYLAVRKKKQVIFGVSLSVSLEDKDNKSGSN